MADKLTSLLSDVQNLVNISYEVVKSGSKTTEAATLLTLADKIVAEVKPRYVLSNYVGVLTSHQSHQNGERQERRCSWSL